MKDKDSLEKKQNGGGKTQNSTTKTNTTNIDVDQFKKLLNNMIKSKVSHFDNPLNVMQTKYNDFTDFMSSELRKHILESENKSKDG
jgi:hypothetical protein